MRVMISQPMNGKTTEQVRDERAEVVTRLEAEGHTVVDSIVVNIPPDTDNKALYCLGEAMKIMATCDAVYFMDGWEKARGCLIEHQAADAYGVQVLEYLLPSKLLTKDVVKYGSNTF